MPTKTGTKPFICVVRPGRTTGQYSFHWEGKESRPAALSIKDAVSSALRTAATTPTDYPGIAAMGRVDLWLSVSGQPVGFDDLGHLLPILEEAARAFGTLVERRAGALLIQAQWRSKERRTLDTGAPGVAEREETGGARIDVSKDSQAPGPLQGESPSVASDRIRQIKALLDEPPAPDYERAREQATRLGDLARTEIAARLAPALNARLAEMPQQEHAQRQHIASWVNGELRALHLAVRDRVSGRPAIIIANLGGQRRTVSRFWLQVTESDGARKRTWNGVTLPPLELMPDVPRAEPFAGWVDRSGRTGRAPQSR